jgi:hypothetical protein
MGISYSNANGGYMRKIAGVLIVSICLALIIVGIPLHGIAAEIYGCVGKNGTLKIVSSPDLCGRGEAPLTWNLGIKTTRQYYTGGNNGLNSSENNWSQYTFITPAAIPFMKYYDNSTLFITWNNEVVGATINSGIGYCSWQVSIDGLYWLPDQINHPVYTNSENSVPVSLKTAISSVPSGTHTVELWFRSANAGCYVNPGGFGGSFTVVEIPQD